MDHTEKALLLFAGASIFLYGGAYFGWGPMQLLLEENGNFQYLCPPPPTEESATAFVCEAQTAALLNIRFYSQLSLFLSPVLGIVSDRFGPPALCCSMAVSAIVGLAIVWAATTSSNVDRMLYLGFTCLGTAASGYGMLTMSTGLVFEDEKLRSRVISWMNSLFDAGAVTYWGLWGVYEFSNGAVTLSSLVVGYLVMAVLCLGGYWYLLRKVVLGRNKDGGSEDVEGGDLHSVEIVLPLTEGIQAAALGEHKETEFVERNTTEKKNAEDINADDSIVSIIPEKDNNVQDVKTYVKIANRSFAGQIKSQLFIMLGIFFCFHLTSNIWTLSTARDFLKYLGDDDVNNRYLTLFTLMTPVSLLALPFVDVSIHKFGFHTALQSVNALAILHGIVKVAFTDLNVQIVGFVLFSFFRCFLFSVSLSCLPTFISPDISGRAVSLLYCVSGACTSLNIPFAALALERGDGDFFLPNLLYLVMTVPMIVVTWFIGKGLERDHRALG